MFLYILLVASDFVSLLHWKACLNVYHTWLLPTFKNEVLKRQTYVEHGCVSQWISGKGKQVLSEKPTWQLKVFAISRLVSRLGLDGRLEKSGSRVLAGAFSLVSSQGFLFLTLPYPLL